jgi:hypothetical protein
MPEFEEHKERLQHFARRIRWNIDEIDRIFTNRSNTWADLRNAQTSMLNELKHHTEILESHMNDFKDKKDVPE